MYDAVYGIMHAAVFDAVYAAVYAVPTLMNVAIASITKIQPPSFVKHWLLAHHCLPLHMLFVTMPITYDPMSRLAEEGRKNERNTNVRMGVK
jgi:hypothetical protein